MAGVVEGGNVGREGGLVTLEVRAPRSKGGDGGVRADSTETPACPGDTTLLGHVHSPLGHRIQYPDTWT